MLKLFKDLTRPPEPLSPRPLQADLHPHTPPRAPRSRGRSPGPGSVPNSPAKRAVELPVEEEVGTEVEGDAKKVSELLEELERVEGGVMGYVEILSQLNSIPGTARALHTFRRQKGFSRLISALRNGLAGPSKPSSEDERNVEEIQRLEGLRIWFEVLGWALRDRDNHKAFDALGGYMELLEPLRKLGHSVAGGTTIDDDPSTSTSSPNASADSISATMPNLKVLAHLLAHVLNDNYTLLSVVPSAASGINVETTALAEQLGDIGLTRPRALPLLWSYLWSLPLGSPHVAPDKGKGRAKVLQWEQSIAGSSEGHSERSQAIEITLQILLVTAQASIVNLFALKLSLQFLPSFLMDRLYGPEPERKYEITFPPRDDWFTPDEEDRTKRPAEGINWTPPVDKLRSVYLLLLRRLLEAGVDQALVWRLFGRARVALDPPKTDTVKAEDHVGEDPPSPEIKEIDYASPTVEATDSSSSIISASRRSITGSPLSLASTLDTSAPTTPTPDPLPKRRKPPNLVIDPPPPVEVEKLDMEVLDLIRHSLKSKWPDVFAFRGSRGSDEGGIELRDMGRAWPQPSKGFNFSCWIYISKLNRPITLIQASQASQKHPLFQVRILENSQVALLSSVHEAHTAASTSTTDVDQVHEPEEIICSAPDALIAHGQWIHFALGCRQPKGMNTAEARIFVNGVRVGAMRVPYPVPAPPGPPQPHILNSKPGPTADAIRLSICKGWIRSDEEKAETKVGVGREEDNEYLLGRSLLVEDALPEDIVLLMFHLGPRYHGNFHDPLGKFLTYEAATSINVYLSSQAQDATDKSLFTSRSNSVIVKAIRQGNTIPEENILLSISAKDAYKSSEGTLPDSCGADSVAETVDTCVNAAVPHPTRAKQLRHGLVSLCGSPGTVESYPCHDMDDSVSCVGGGAVVLRMIDMAKTNDELAITLGILRDMLKGSWAASEEIERIRGYDLLAAILRPKMVNLVDIHCTKIILGMLGINMDRPVTATVHNSAAYRALGLEFELWARASLGVVTLYLQHFEYLLASSKHARYNVLRTFQKAAMVRKMLYALRSGFFDLAVVPVVVDTLKLVLIARWSGEDAIKPIFSFSVSSLCQSSSSVYPSTFNNEPPPSQAPAAQILAMIAVLSHNGQRLVKLTRSIALHRLLVIFISSNSAPYVITPCLDILERCLLTSGLESFQRLFEAEGGFALLARSLGAVWTGDMQARVLRMLTGPGSADGKSLQCPALVSTLLAALDCLLQGDDPFRPSRRGSISSIRSVTMTPLTTEMNGTSPADDTRLEDLFRDITALYRTNSLFRRAFTNRRVEQMLPAIVDFAAMTTTSSSPERSTAQRAAAAVWLQAIADKHKISHSIINQIKLVIEQLRSPSAPSVSASVGASLSRVPSSPRPSSVHLAKSFTGSRMGVTPPGTPSPAGPIPRRRISTEVAFSSGSPFSATRSKFSERRPPALKRVLTGESILEGGRDKNAAWKLIIIQTDSQSHSKMTLERKEHWRRLSEVDWPRVAAGIRAENGLWPEDEGIVQWRLDGSEGPLRMRNRLERVQGTPEPVQGWMQRKLRDAIPSVDELSSAVSRVNLAPWEDPFALALGQAAPITEEAEAQPLVDPSGPPRPPSPTESRLDDESFVEIEENKDDKMRRIAKTLQAGDVVEEAHNIVRIVGVDACPGLLILGKKNLYLVDGLVQTAEGEVIDARDAPRDVLTIPGTMIDTSSSEQESLRWPYSEVIETNKRAFLFRDVALELYFSDKRNFLVVFKDKRERQVIVTKLQYKTDQAGVISRSFIGNFVLDQVVRAIEKPGQDLDALTRKWQTREISNFAYLSLLNQYANRTPNDVTQYPVFPWVLADYASPILDLTKPSSFRDLSLPMGALTPARKEAAVERYSATEGVGEKPFHYGTHYSSSMIVCGFLIRLSPFTEIFLALQGGNFDLADRLFSSVARAWDSASADNRGDVRELIPEFYYSSAFYINLNHHDFGKKQVSGDSVDNVMLPPWALGDPLLFTHKHREALESDYVSRHLPAWIDLTFGYKQRDPAAFNCFHPLSYRGGVDLEHMEDEGELAASTAIIHNFGQTPVQIFKTSHPVRFSGRSTLPFGQNFGVAEQWQLLIRSKLPITETVLPIDDISIPSIPESKPAVFQRHRLLVPGSPLLTVHYGFADDSLRILYQDLGSLGARLVHIIDGISVVHAVFATPTLLVTVSWDSVITVWRLHVKSYGYKKGDVAMQREAILRGHTSKVTCLAASTSWSFLVSCSENGNAKIWDMNRLRYTRTIQIPTKDPIKFCSINESDGQIAIATATHLFLYSLNGHPVASTRVDTSLVTDFVYDEPDGSVFSDSEVEEYTGGISFLKREFLPFGVLFVVGIGREVALYRCVPGVRRFADEEGVMPWQLIEQGRLARSDDHDGGNCCMVKFAGETLYAAFEPSEENSKYTLYQWSLPEGSQRHVPESVSHVCMAELCGRHFGLLEPKRYCGGCGGAFCGTHAVHVETLENRYCADCRAQLGQSQALLNMRRDSAIPSSRRGSMSGHTSGPSSRRQSFGTGVQGPSSRRPSVSRVLAKAAIAASALAEGNRSRSGTLVGDKPDQEGGSSQSREATPLLAVP